MRAPGKYFQKGQTHSQTSHSHLATQPEFERHTASHHDLAVPSAATVSDDRSDTYVTKPGIAVEANAITVSDDSGHDIDVSGTVPETDITTVSDDSDHDIHIPGTAVEANAAQINSSAKSTCGSMDLSWAFDAPFQELLNGHPNDQYGLPLCALAKALANFAIEKGVAISDHTLVQVLQCLEKHMENYEVSIFAESWRCRVTKIVMGSSDVLVRVTMSHSSDSFRGNTVTSLPTSMKSLLALRLRMRSGRASTLDRGLTFASCADCLSTIDMRYWIFTDDTIAAMDEMLESGKTTVSCIISRMQWNVSIER